MKAVTQLSAPKIHTYSMLNFKLMKAVQQLSAPKTHTYNASEYYIIFQFCPTMPSTSKVNIK